MTDLDSLRYPIGRFNPPANPFPDERAAQITTLRQVPDRLRDAVKDLNDEQLDTPYRESGWTVRQLVHHFVDSHMNSYVRFKLALTEDWATIKPYDEAAWATLPDSRLPIEPSLELVASIHTRWVALIGAMSEGDFAKGFNHSERGRLNLATTLAVYDRHSRHHTAHITALRAREGWQTCDRS